MSVSFEDTEADFDKAGTSKKSYFANQQEMDDLIRDMGLINKLQNFLLHDYKSGIC